MNDTTDEGTGTGGGTPLVITPQIVTTAAETAGAAATALRKTPGYISGPTEAATAALKGWDASMGTLSKVAKQWGVKTAALVDGDEGVDEFGRALTQFVTEVTAQDKSNAGALATEHGVEAEFGGAYTPVAASEAGVDRLLNGT